MNFGGKEFREFKNVLTPEEHTYCVEFLKQRRWALDNWSETHEDLGMLAWSFAGLEEDSFFKETFINRIKELTGYDYEVLAIYANGQTFGQDGVFHVDDINLERNHARTFIYYPTKLSMEELYDYGGDTLFIQQDGKIHHVHPITNSAVFFDGRIWHKGMGPTRRTNKLRISVAFKLYIKN